MFLPARFFRFVAPAVVLLAACGGEDTRLSREQSSPLEARAETPARSIPEGVKSVRGAGSTFVYPALRLWSRSFYQAAEVEVVFDAVGSDAGLEQLDKGEVTFAAIDLPLREDQLALQGWVQWPVIAGGIVPVVNLLVEPGELVLDGPTLADIYLGKINSWSHPRIQELNPRVDLPDSPITVVRRGDASGTTYNFTEYLSKASV